jgi:hypothetical protein
MVIVLGKKNNNHRYPILLLTASDAHYISQRDCLSDTISMQQSQQSDPSGNEGARRRMQQHFHTGSYFRTET